MKLEKSNYLFIIFHHSITTAFITLACHKYENATWVCYDWWWSIRNGNAESIRKRVAHSWNACTGIVVLKSFFFKWWHLKVTFILLFFLLICMTCLVFITLNNLSSLFIYLDLYFFYFLLNSSLPHLFHFLSFHFCFVYIYFSFLPSSFFDASCLALISSTLVYVATSTQLNSLMQFLFTF